MHGYKWHLKFKPDFQSQKIAVLFLKLGSVPPDVGTINVRFALNLNETSSHYSRCYPFKTGDLSKGWHMSKKPKTGDILKLCKLTNAYT